MTKRLFALALALCFALGLTAQQKRDPRDDSRSYDLAEMYQRHFTKVNDQFWTGGQPPIAELARLKAGGIKVILDLQHPGEHNVAAEAAEAKRLGMRYMNIPVVFREPKDEQADEFLRITDDPANRPMFIHCTMAVRVGAFWMIRRVLRDGWSVEKAEAEAREIGLGARHLLAFAKNYIAKHQKAPAAQAQPRNSMLVDTAWLAEHIADPSLVLLHVGEREGYDAAHIPGAQFIELRQIAAPPAPAGQGLALEMPPVEQLQAAFEKFGVTDDSRIVIYVGKDWVTPAGRVFLTLDYLGFGERTSILDGGMPAWQAEGRPVTMETRAPVAGKLTPRPRADVVVDAAFVSARLDDPSLTLVDARLARFYDGSERGRMPRAGHIPGARSIPFPSVFEESGKLKDVAALREQFAAADVKPGTLVVTYCHIGQQASLLYFVARYLGYDARMYDGSFEDWSSRSELPVVASASPR
jgi:thiosulfate/3-mercaptopyruvate sulfurtransferase